MNGLPANWLDRIEMVKRRLRYSREAEAKAKAGADDFKLAVELANRYKLNAAELARAGFTPQEIQENFNGTSKEGAEADRG